LSVFQIAALNGDRARCQHLARSYLSFVAAGDSPLLAAAAARIGFQALTLAGSPSEPQTSVLRDEATRELDRAEQALTDEWRPSYFGVQLELARGYAARDAGTSGASHFREAATLSGPFGDFFALEPRLELAQELLDHGSRDEGRELLVDCWTSGHDMGARGLERRAARLATRFRVPLPGAATSEGPLSRLTPREREVLDRLAKGTTNRAIAQDLVISEKTVSVHVSNVLAKLGVENRGAAAALARELA
jgi:DNA-binding CsgD family transcriptional regulator